MKKLIYVLSILLLSFGLVACDSGEKILVLPENIETIKIEAESPVPYLLAPLEITKEDTTYDDFLLWLNELEFTEVDESKLDGCDGGTDYSITINDDTKLSYIDACGYYAKIDDQLYEASNPNPFPYKLDDFPIDMLFSDGLIKPCDLSEETIKTIGIIQPDVYFYDVIINQNIENQKISVLEYHDGVWEEISHMSDIKEHRYQLALQINDDCVDIYSIYESGHTKWSVPFDRFDENLISSSSYIQDYFPIEVGKELSIAFRVTSLDAESQSFVVGDHYDDYPCGQGIAIVLEIN